MRAGLAGLAGLAVLAVLAGCGTSGVVGDGEPVAEPYVGPLSLPVSHADRASVLERSGAAGRALECGTRPYAGGAGDYDSGLASVQGSAAAALENHLAEEWVGELPGEGYRVEREVDGRVLFSYDVAGRTKVAFIAADGVRDFDGEEGWGIETWAQCDPSELPPAVTEALGIGVWEDESGDRVPVSRVRSFQGPRHCDWEDITFLVLGEGGRRERVFLRDPDGTLGNFARTTFATDVSLPEGATDTGLERDGRRLWLDRDGAAAYLVDEDDRRDVERWPAAKRRVGCA